MIKIRKNAEKMLKNIVKHEAKLSANSTTCVVAYQPTAPASLKKFSKVDNDK